MGAMGGIAMAGWRQDQLDKEKSDKLYAQLRREASMMPMGQPGGAYGGGGGGAAGAMSQYGQPAGRPTTATRPPRAPLPQKGPRMMPKPEEPSFGQRLGQAALGLGGAVIGGAIGGFVPGGSLAGAALGSSIGGQLGGAAGDLYGSEITPPGARQMATPRFSLPQPGRERASTVQRQASEGGGGGGGGYSSGENPYVAGAAGRELGGLMGGSQFLGAPTGTEDLDAWFRQVTGNSNWLQ
jgi:hypothetical protein